MAKVILELTMKEARALAFAAGEMLDHPDAMEAWFPEPTQRRVAYSAGNKLTQAIREANDPSIKKNNAAANFAVHRGVKMDIDKVLNDCAFKGFPSKPLNEYTHAEKLELLEQSLFFIELIAFITGAETHYNSRTDLGMKNFFRDLVALKLNCNGDLKESLRTIDFQVREIKAQLLYMLHNLEVSEPKTEEPKESKHAKRKS